MKELRDQLAQVEEWEQRRSEIDADLSKVWTVRADDAGEGGQGIELEAAEYRDEADDEGLFVRDARTS